MITLKILFSCVSVLGVSYTIREGTSVDFPALQNCDGFCDTSTKEIVVSDLTESAASPDAMKDLERYQRKVIRHELVHAFLYESGLSSDSWADNEEIVDWLAIQFPKLQAVFNAAQCLKEGD